MFDELRDAIGAGVAALIGGVLSSLFGLAYWARLHKKVDNSAEEIKRLRDENIAKLEKKVEDHVKEDKSQQILTELKNVGGAVARLTDKVDNLAVETGRQGAQIKANADYTSNLYKSMQELRKETRKK